MIELDLNSGFVSPSLVGYAREKAAAEGKSVERLEMSKAEWDKIFRNYEEADRGDEVNLIEASKSFAGHPVVILKTVPRDTIHLMQGTTIVGKLVNIG